MIDISIIITTYNAEEWLQKVLIGYLNQSFTNFEIIIADDGSTSKTTLLIKRFENQFKHPIIHVWQEDQGFQKPKILNKAILKSNASYLIFTDGDCIPHQHFVKTHFKQRAEGYFLSGGYFKLPLSISKLISPKDIVTQRCFDAKWLIHNGLKINFKITKLIKNAYFAAFMNWITPTKRSWNGHNASGWKQDILDINGFNHEMQYGGLDREMGERLFNNGLLSKQIRYSAICIHLEHKRGYANAEIWKKNNEIRKYNKKNKITFIENGISSLI
ncbi:glycosyltransferase family 2 protein [Flavobacterium branchiophilum]|uniref:Glycosyl transferase family 2 n=1 Tax=Flavobacterium branchiophilum TaxID=55197 RepID=A0A2H3KQQ6_9FLAO|nr:glycosyltransferase family 2 protein [Flavobacterium branchiophilum]PDS26838.1 glycosyl transferase family 2 [Flavobacterium branchiophilum]